MWSGHMGVRLSASGCQLLWFQGCLSLTGVCFQALGQFTHAILRDPRVFHVEAGWMDKYNKQGKYGILLIDIVGAYSFCSGSHDGNAALQSVGVQWT